MDRRSERMYPSVPRKCNSLIYYHSFSDFFRLLMSNS